MDDLTDATAEDLRRWLDRVLMATYPAPETIRATVDQVKTIVESSRVTVPEVRFGTPAKLFGMEVEWVRDPVESTFAEGRRLEVEAARYARPAEPVGEDLECE